MVDGARLREQFKKAVVMCLGITSIPFILGVVLIVMSASPDRTPTEPVDPVMTVVFGLLALSPLVTVPVVRRFARTSIAAPQQPPIGVEANIRTWAVAEYTLWELASLMGFVGVVSGAPMTFFLVFALITLTGYAYSFPRWSHWTALVVELGLSHDANSFTLA